MFGKIDLSVGFIFAICLIAAATDLKSGKIFNWLTLPAMAAGILYSTWFSGLPGLGSSLLGAVAGLLLFGWMFLGGFMGGGDVKLVMALGAWGGPRYALELALLSILVGGVLAAITLLFKGRLPDFGRRLYRFLLTVFIQELEVETPQIDRKQTMPFGVSIAIAAIWAALASPLAWLGLGLGGHPL